MDLRVRLKTHSGSSITQVEKNIQEANQIKAMAGPPLKPAMALICFFYFLLNF